MILVLDGSYTLAWCFEDETNAVIDATMLRVAAEGATVPAIWRLEVANGLIPTARIADSSRQFGRSVSRAGLVGRPRAKQGLIPAAVDPSFMGQHLRRLV